MQQAAVIAAYRLEGMGEGMPEIQQRPLAGFMLVRLDNPCLCRAGCQDGVCQRGFITLQNIVPFASSHSKKPASPRSPYFTTSA